MSNQYVALRRLESLAKSVEVFRHWPRNQHQNKANRAYVTELRRFYEWKRVCILAGYLPESVTH